MKKTTLFSTLIVVIFVFSFLYVLWLAKDSCLLHNNWCGQDMDQYVDYVNSLMKGKGYSAHQVYTMYLIGDQYRSLYIPDTMRLPMFPLIILVLKLINNTSAMLLLFNLTLYYFILFYATLLFQWYLPRMYVVPALLLLALFPVLLFYTSAFGNVDILTCFALTGFVFHTLRISQSKRVGVHVFLSSIYGVIALLSRQNSLLFIIPFLVLTSSLHFTPKLRLQVTRSYLVIWIALALGMGMWIVRVYHYTNTLTVSTLSGMQLYSEFIYFTPVPTKESAKILRWMDVEKGGQKYVANEIRKGKTIPQAYASFNQYMTAKVIRYLVHNPVSFVRHYMNAVISIYRASSFTWNKSDLFSLLNSMGYIAGSLMLIGNLLCPFTMFGRNMLRSTNIIVLWISSNVYILISAFFHGIVIGNRGILPLLPISVLLLFFSINHIIVRLAEYETFRNLRKTIGSKMKLGKYRINSENPVKRTI